MLSDTRLRVNVPDLLSSHTPLCGAIQKKIQPRKGDEEGRNTAENKSEKNAINSQKEEICVKQI